MRMRQCLLGLATGGRAVLPASLFVWCLAVGPVLAQHAISPELERDWGLPSDERPLKVALSLFVVDFARLNGREETFELHGYLEACWKDPGLARETGGTSKGPRRLKPGSIWMPELDFVNAQEQPKIHHESDLVVEDDGTVLRPFDFTARFSTPMDLRRFPFDTQALLVIIQPADYETKDLVLVADRARVGVSSDAFMTDWTVGAADARVLEHGYSTDGSTYSRYQFEVAATRRSTFYVWRVLLPLTLLVVASWVAFWFDVTGLQPQISTTLSILLAVVLFNFSMDFSLPKVPYLTFIDRHAITAFGFAFAAILTVSAAHVVLNRSGLAAAQRVQWVARRAFPAAYALAIVAGLLLG